MLCFEALCLSAHLEGVFVRISPGAIRFQFLLTIVSVERHSPNGDKIARAAYGMSMCSVQFVCMLAALALTAFRGRAAARSQERAAAHLQAPPYLAFALAAAAVMAEGSAKAITASPSAKLLPGSPPKPYTTYSTPFIS